MPIGEHVDELIHETVVYCGGKDGPYLMESVQRTLLRRRMNPLYNADAVCKCGHPYHRHFDPYENNSPVGCKYCACRVFEPE